MSFFELNCPSENTSPSKIKRYGNIGIPGGVRSHYSDGRVAVT